MHDETDQDDSGRIIRHPLTGLIHLIRKPLPYLVILAGIGITIGLVTARNEVRQKIIPTSIAEQVLFPVYAPFALPPGYRVNPNTYAIKSGSLLFAAANQTNKQAANIVFSEQAMTSSIDFTAFYQQYIIHPLNLQNVPYTSVIGSLTDGSGRNMLSITTRTTWLIVTAPKSITPGQMQLIAQNIKQQ